MSGTVHQEFLRWARTLDATSLDEYQIKLLNMLIADFDAVLDSGTAAGKRARLISKVIQEKRATVSATLGIEADALAVGPVKNYRIDFLEIGPFRGFSTKEKFLLEKKYTFLYGPNGSGKSSFCEGLEYALLGDIEEASAKRIGIGEYIQNTETKSASEPIVYSIVDGKKKVISPDQNRYRFAFIEKNRIDGFARITAATAGVQKDRIATLFGLDAFSDFVDGFTDNFASYLPIDATIAKKYELEVQTQNTNKALQEKNANDRILVADEITAIIADIGIVEVDSLEKINLYLNGSDGVSGKLIELQREKTEQVQEDENYNVREALPSRLTALRELISAISADLEQLHFNSSQVNFSELYSALSAIESADPENTKECPACRTPIASVAVNPFQNAKSELSKLKSLSELQERIPRSARDIVRKVAEVKSILEELRGVAQKVSYSDFPVLEMTEVEYLSNSDVASWSKLLIEEISILEKAASHIELLARAVVAYNLNLANKRARKITVDEAIRKAQRQNTKCIDLIGTSTRLANQKEELSTAMAEFESKNAEKLSSIDTEKKLLEEYSKYIVAYDALIGMLKNYRTSLPKQLAVGLSQAVVKFYNIINSHDPDFEKLSYFALPSTPGEKISIKFVGENRVKDALHVLSEGHIKVLGLSILLAKVVQSDLDFMIFDDIVNAIDDDHRSGIADLLLTCNELRDRQQIITCHGEQFINKLEHRLGASTASREVMRYRFYPTDSAIERGVKLSIGDTKHYLLLAKECFDNGALKDSASKCRQAVESLTETLWKKLANTKSVNLTVKLRSPGAQPDLATVVDALVKELKGVGEASTLHARLSELKEKYPWSLLNKGTHEQDSLPEFDRSDVSSLIQLLESIESQVLSIVFTVVVSN